jgi:hypothetical protein
MSQADTTQWARSSKLAAVTGVVALCLFGGAFFSGNTLRLVAWGAAAGLVCMAVGVLVDAYRRRAPPDMSRAAVDKKARQARTGTKVALLFAIVVVPAINLAPSWLFAELRWPLVGFFSGVFAFVALRFGPFFYPLVRNARSSPLPGMTTMERAARAPMEPSRQQDSR